MDCKVLQIFIRVQSRIAGNGVVATEYLPVDAGFSTREAQFSGSGERISRDIERSFMELSQNSDLYAVFGAVPLPSPTLLDPSPRSQVQENSPYSPGFPNIIFHGSLHYISSGDE